MDDSSNENENSSPRRLLSGLTRFLNPGNDDSNQQQNSNYGSIGSSRKLIFDGSDSADLGNILENEELHAPLTAYNEEIGTADESPSSNDDNDGNYDGDDDGDEELTAGLSNLSSTSFHCGVSTRMSSRNIMVHERRTSSFLAQGEYYELVPTQLKNKVRMVEDANLIDGTTSKGRLYLARYSFFQNDHDLKYALTVQPDIYERIMSEVNDAFTIPCGLYFCCHGGDGAHTGVSHNDYVDIKLAWFFFLVVIGFLLAIEFLVE